MAATIVCHGGRRFRMNGAMLATVLFWLIVAADAAAIGLVFVLGLAAAGPAKTSPLAVATTLLVVPGVLLAGAVLVFVRAQSPAWRVVALLIAAAPAIAVVVAHVRGAIALHRAAGGIVDSTPLTRALRALEHDPGQLDVVRTLLAQGADPNAAADEPPLVLAIFAARHVGPEPVRLLLDAGVQPNAVGQFGTPAWFVATGITVDVAVLALLLDRGADVAARGHDGRGAVWHAVNAWNWPAALLLLRRGADCDGRSPMGTTLLDVVEAHVRTHGDGTGAGDVLTEVRRKTRGH